ncbi:hypothetical protein AX16_008594 [Volvariella volvacea WC 439]|nr:hypothetical protein AX16_008594 [Volvariella volvacea WC 439]
MAPQRPSAFEVSFPGEHQDSLSDTSPTLVSVSVPSKRSGGFTPGRVETGKRTRLDPGQVVYYSPPPNEEILHETADLILEGEDEFEDSSDAGEDEKKPVRILLGFSFFDTHHRNVMMPLDSLEAYDRDDICLEGAGYVLPYILNDEDQGQEDGLGEQQPRYIRLSVILRYSIDYTKASEPFYIETTFAWYILKMPSLAYVPLYRSFYTPRRITQLILSQALHPSASPEAFLSQLTATADIFGHTYQLQDLYNAAEELNEAIEEMVSPSQLRQTPLLRHIFGKMRIPHSTSNPQSRAQRRTHVPPPFLRSITTLAGNPDLAVLKAENQNPTHVTPIVAQLAQGFVREELVVVGPKPAIPNKVAMEQHKERARRFLQACIRRAKKRVEIDYDKKDRLRPGSAYIKQITVDGEVFKEGDFVVVPIGEEDNRKSKPVGLPNEDELPESATLADFFWFARIVYIKHEERVMHVQWLEHGSQILLQELSHPQELFLNNWCSVIHLETLCGKINVHRHPVEPDSEDYFYRFMYDHHTSSFTSVNPKWDKAVALDEPPNNCSVCLQAACHDQDGLPRSLKGPDGSRNGITYQDRKYHINDFVLYHADSQKSSKKDPQRGRPAHIGHIKDIWVPKRRADQQTILVTMWKVGRIVDLGHLLPEDFLRDERHVYITEEEVSVPLASLIQVVFVVAEESVGAGGVETWTDKSPYHFYARYRFPKLDVRSWAEKTKLKWKTLDTCSICWEELLEREEDTEKIAAMHQRHPLRTLDLFGGVGAFSLGMKEGSGAIKVTHAVEISPSAAATFRRNSPDTIVYNQCTNVMLRYAIKHYEGHEVQAPKSIDNTGTIPPPPRPGEIDLIVAGFPCQTHSGLNMFKNADDIKSNLILNAISWVDHYRPKLCYFENVPGFLNFNLNAVQAGLHSVQGGIEMGGLKILVRSMTEIGYQCRFALLEAAHYGAPQGRVRFFLIAARDGLILPEFPQPTHAFMSQALKIRLPFPMTGGERTVIKPIRTTPGTAAHPHVNIDDAIGDLPRFDWQHPKPTQQTSTQREEARQRKLNNIPALDCDRKKKFCGFKGSMVPYHHEPITPYQVRARRNATMDLQHYTKCLLPEKVKRVIAIPLAPGADYRSLPPDLYEWQSANPNSSVAKAGYKAGMYGRLDRKGVFPTTVTNVDPTAKQSRVVNPYCKRMVTVRELARSQGFPDDFVFKSVGELNVVTLHRQIGNAVPWPIGIALGRELREALFKKWKSATEDATVVE